MLEVPFVSFYQTRGEQLHTLQPHVQYCDHPMGCFQLFNVTKHVCAYFWLIVSITRVDTVSESCNIVRHSAFQYISMHLVELFMSGKQMCSSIISTRYIYCSSSRAKLPSSISSTSGFSTSGPTCFDAMFASSS